MKKLGQALFLSLVAWLTMFADCDRNVTRDPGFSDWCGDQLCFWKVEKGSVFKVQTWDVYEYGVALPIEFCDLIDPECGLDGGPSQMVQISQLTVESEARCLEFTTLGKFDPVGDVSVSADFNNDGTIDFTNPLGGDGWTKVQVGITAPVAYRGVTFYVQKTGNASPVLAQLRVQANGLCSGLPIKLTQLPVGDACSIDGGECATGTVCAPVAGQKNGICSACASTCPGGLACAQYTPNMPFLCAPGRGLLQTGAACLSGGDCLTGVCTGAKAQQLLLDDAGTCDLEALGLDGGENCKNFGALAGKCQ